MRQAYGTSTNGSCHDFSALLRVGAQHWQYHAGGINHGHAARCTTLRESPSCQALDGSAHPDFIQKNVTSNQKYSAQSFADYDQY
jgi:hypothetical protein